MRGRFFYWFRLYNRTNSKFMQKKDSIKDDGRDPLISYFRSLEEEVPEENIAKRWNQLVQKVNEESAPKRHKRLRIYMQIACAAALLTGIAWGIKTYLDANAHSIDTAIALLEECRTDTIQEVLLITHAQQRIATDKGARISYSKQGEASVNEQQVESKPQKTEYNQLIVPKGKHSQLLLADGTSLHINAGTKVVYPSVFQGKYREIYVDGEIYIDVKKDTGKPFIVKTPGFDIRVTGTAFNVNAYASMPEAEVVLLRGAIIVKDRADKETAVKPGELLEVSNGVAHDKRTVNAEEYMAWTKGHFPLQGRNMEAILQRLSLFYGCEISCDPAIKDFPLQGTIDLSVPLLKVLERISKMYPIGIRETSDRYYLFINPNTNH